MAKVTITFEDKKKTNSGAWLDFKFVVEPPIDIEKMSTNGKLDPNKCTEAQFLANAVGLYIQKEWMTMRALK